MAGSFVSLSSGDEGVTVTDHTRNEYPGIVLPAEDAYWDPGLDS